MRYRLAFADTTWSRYKRRDKGPGHLGPNPKISVLSWVYLGVAV